MHKSPRFPRHAAAVASIPLCAILAGRAAATQYSVVVLSSQGIAWGVNNGRAVGYDDTGSPTVWLNNGATPVHLALPPGFTSAAPHAISGNQLVGPGDDPADNLEHAVLWSSIGSVPVDLGGGEAGGIYAGVEVGQDQGARAVAWRGTAASMFVLNPPSFNTYSDATGIWGNEVSGRWYNNPNGTNPHPALWTSLSPSGFVDLSGPTAPFGAALAVSRGQVAGWASTGGKHAAIWAGTAASFQDLAPAGITASELWGTNGTQQVGDVSLMPGVGGLLPPDHHAAVWTGTPNSYQLLPAPGDANALAYGSIAYGIDGQGDIVGVFDTYPVMWIPQRLPGDANFDGTVNFSDLLILAQHYGQPGEWVDGEFSGGGTVNFSDLLTLAQHYGQVQSASQLYGAVSLGPDAPARQVPEPAAAAAAFVSLFSLRRRRK